MIGQKLYRLTEFSLTKFELGLVNRNITGSDSELFPITESMEFSQSTINPPYLITIVDVCLYG